MKVSTAPAAQASETTMAQDSTAELSEGELTPRVRELLHTLQGEIATLKAELDESRARIGELEELADSDPLCGVFNRRGFVRELQRAIAMTDRYKTPSSLIFADVNDLKVINDEFGHKAGDAALAHIARVLSGNVRKSDSVGRLGGDEFGVILIQTDGVTAHAKAEALIAGIAAASVEWDGPAFKASISVGVAEIPRNGSAEDALAAADQAMYAAKRGK